MSRKARHQAKSAKKSSMSLFGGLLAVILLIGAGAWYYAKPSVNDEPAVRNTGEPVSIDHEWGLGNPDAKLTIVEYGDYQCPACGYYHPIVKGLLEEFGDDVYFVWRHFPLVHAHQFATAAASAAEAAGRQGKFWEMHDMIMSNQQSWSRGMATSAFLTYARELGLDDEQFLADVRDPAILQKIERDYNSGIQRNIGSVPSFFFNGVYLPTPRTPEAFRQLIQDQLDRINSGAE